MVIVRAVKIDKVCAEILQDGEIAGTAIHELPSVPLGRNRSFKDQFPVLAGIHSRFLQQGINRSGVIQSEDRLDPGSCGTGTDDAAVSSFPEQELQCSQDHRFPGAGLARHGGESGRKFPFQHLDEG